MSNRRRRAGQVSLKLKLFNIKFLHSNLLVVNCQPRERERERERDASLTSLEVAQREGLERETGEYLPIQSRGQTIYLVQATYLCTRQRLPRLGKQRLSSQASQYGSLQPLQSRLAQGIEQAYIGKPTYPSRGQARQIAQCLGQPTYLPRHRPTREARFIAQSALAYLAYLSRQVG